MKLRLCQVAFLLAAWAPALHPARADDAPRVAVLDFVLASTPGLAEASLTTLSRGVQANLLTHDGYVWVERQEMDRLTQEADLGRLSRVDARHAVRLGHLLRADLLVRGEITAKDDNDGELTVEVIDLARADVLASRKVALPLADRIHPEVTTARVEQIATESLAALTDARQRLSETAKLRVIAPLFFSNTGATDRLNFLEDRLQAALAAIPATNGCRALRYPRTDAASAESNLVLAGLTDSDPDAWQHVADAFVWGSFAEEPADGVAFDDVPVKISVLVWTGTGDPREIAWRGAVRDLSTGVQTVTSQVAEFTRAAPTNVVRGNHERELIGQLFQKRLKEVWQPITAKYRQYPDQETYFKTPQGRQALAYRRRLLQTASFFEPLNASLQRDRVEGDGFLVRDFDDPHQYEKLWLRLADMVIQGKRFRFAPDGSLDPTWPSLISSEIGALEYYMKLPVGDPRKNHHSPEEYYLTVRALRQIRGQLVVEINQLARQQARPPPWLPRQNNDWVDAIFEGSRVGIERDPLVVHEEMEFTWPVLSASIGEFLRSNVDDRRKQGLLDHVMNVYGSVGQGGRGFDLLIKAWRSPPDAYSSDTMSPALKAALEANQAAAAAKRALRPPTPVLAWAPESAAGLPSAPKLLPGLKALAASVRELEPRREVYSRLDDSSDIHRFLKGPTMKYPAVAWDGTQLWCGDSYTGEIVPSVSGPAPQTQHFWHGDLARNSFEELSARFGKPATVRTLSASGGKIWAAFEGAGLWEVDAKALTAKSIDGSDGLMTSDLFTSCATADAVYLLGRAADGTYYISQSLVAGGKWTGIRVPATSRPKGKASVPDPTVAVSGDWIALVVNRTALFYNQASRQWVNLLDETSKADPAQPAAPRGFTFVRGDEHGFWLGSLRGVQFLDPHQPGALREIRVPVSGPPLLASQSGPWLWLGYRTENSASHLVLIDKRTNLVVGTVPLPMDSLLSLAAHENAVWAGGSKLLEIRLQGGNTGALAANDGSLFGAAWSGNLGQLDAALAAKPEVNESTSQGWTPLMSAAASGRVAIVTRLLAAGAKPNHLAENGATALQLATEAGDRASVDALLAAGALPDLASQVILRREAVANRLVSTPWPAVPTGKTPVAIAIASHAQVDELGDVTVTWQKPPGHTGGYMISRKTYETSSWGQYAVIPPGQLAWTDRSLGREALVVQYAVFAASQPSQSDFRGASGTETSSVQRPAPTSPRLRFSGLIDRFAHELVPAALHSRCALAVAAMRGDVEIARRLLDHGADANERDAVGATPLLLALEYGNNEVARLLLERGADAAAMDDDDHTAAYLAYLRHDDEPLFEAILKRLEPARRRIEISSLIATAAKRGQIRDVEQLVARGGDLSAGAIPFFSALACAIRADQVEMVDWLLAHGFPIKSAQYGAEWEEQIAFDACWHDFGHPGDPLLRKVLDAGLNPNVDYEGQPLAAYAIDHDRVDLARLLLSHGADRNVVVKGGKHLSDFAENSPSSAPTDAGPMPPWQISGGFQLHQVGPVARLHYREFKEHQVANERFVTACSKGDLAGAQAALGEGADVNAYGPTQHIPALERAVRSKNIELVRWLLNRGVEINEINSDGKTVLSAAVDVQRMDLVELLLASGADPNAFDARYNRIMGRSVGCSALIQAVQGTDPRFVTRLLEAGAHPDLVGYYDGRTYSALDVALQRGRAEMVTALLDGHADLKAQPLVLKAAPGRPVERRPAATHLMQAAGGGNLALVQKMIALGEDPMAQDNYGDDALSYATYHGAVTVVKFLLPRSQKKGNALIRASEGNHPEVAELLLAAGYSSAE